MPCGMHQIEKPMYCQRTSSRDKCSKDPYSILVSKSTYVDYQEFKI